MITNAGMAEVAGLIGTDTTGDVATFDYIAIGTGTTAPSATDTALANEQQRAAATGTRVTTSVTNDTLQLVKDAFSFSGSYAITEVGVFNASTGGTMLSRSTFSAVNVTANDTLKVTVKIQVKQGT